jgi:hypothetical protein
MRAMLHTQARGVRSARGEGGGREGEGERGVGGAGRKGAGARALIGPRALTPNLTPTPTPTRRRRRKIRRPGAEALLPDFDLSKKVGRKIALQRDRRAVVLVVVDVADFDGSLPRAALRCGRPEAGAGGRGAGLGMGLATGRGRHRRGSVAWALPMPPPPRPPAPLQNSARALFPGIDPAGDDALPPELPFKLMVAANKFDLLPTKVEGRPGLPAAGLDGGVDWVIGGRRG